MPALSWPRCWSAYRPKNARRAGSWPARDAPTMPHLLSPRAAPASGHPGSFPIAVEGPPASPSTTGPMTQAAAAVGRATVTGTSCASASASTGARSASRQAHHGAALVLENRRSTRSHGASEQAGPGLMVDGAPVVWETRISARAIARPPSETSWAERSEPASGSARSSRPEPRSASRSKRGKRPDRRRPVSIFAGRPGSSGARPAAGRLCVGSEAVRAPRARRPRAGQPCRPVASAGSPGQPSRCRG